METVEALRQFFEKTQRDEPVENLVPVLQTLTRDLGFRFFSYLLLKSGECLPGKDTTTLWISNYPKAWKKRYASNSYQYKDPALVDAIRQRRPIRWGVKACLNYEETGGIGNDQRRVLSEASEHGIKRGLTVPINGPGSELGLFTVASGEPAENLEKALCNGSHALHLIATYTHAFIVARSVQIQPQQDIDLTAREKEVLFWTAQGKSSWEISKIIDRSNATVNFHIKHAIRKLNASNKCHAAVKATVFQLIDPYDTQRTAHSDEIHMHL